jgi:glycosyltransferase involved in cell wall biosynthesis
VGLRWRRDMLEGNGVPRLDPDCMEQEIRLGRVYIGDVLHAHRARIEGERTALGVGIEEHLLLIGIGHLPSVPNGWKAKVVAAKNPLDVIHSVRQWLLHTNPDVIHSHSLWATLATIAAVGVRRWKIRIVHEVHGALAFETRMRHRGAGGIARFAVLYILESLALLLAHRSLLVSEAIVKYYPVARLRDRVAIPRVTPAPGRHTSNMRDPLEVEVLKNIRTFVEANRRSNRKLLVYSGGLAPWQLFPAVAEFMADCVADGSCAAVVLTPDQTEAQQIMFSRVGLHPSAVWFGHLSASAVGVALRHCDVGILFREDNVVNAVSSPTKFFEYIAAGLNVLVTRGTPTIADVVDEHGIGFVCQLDRLSQARSWLADLDRSEGEIRRIRQLAKERFTWQSVEVDLQSLYL